MQSSAITPSHEFSITGTQNGSPIDQNPDHDCNRRRYQITIETPGNDALDFSRNSREVCFNDGGAYLLFIVTRQNPALRAGNVNFLIAIEDEYTAVRME